MKRLVSRVRAWIAIAAALAVSGCIYPGAVTVFHEQLTGIISISVGNVEIGTCFPNEDGPISFDCIDPVLSRFQYLTPSELFLHLLVLDPLVVQMPAGASNFQGSYLHAGSGQSGQLAITAGLTSVPIDLHRQFVAEPGMQLVIIGLPAGAPTTGIFSFNLNFRVPQGASSITVKPIITGLVQQTNGTFYPPIVPCVSSMATAPALVIPLPVPGDTLTIPPATGLGCNNVVYDFGGGGAGGGAAPSAEIPALAPWLLALLAAIVGTAAGLRLRRDARDA